MMKLAGIDGVICRLDGQTDLRDYAILHRNTTRLLQQCERLKMKFVICYEDETRPFLHWLMRTDWIRKIVSLMWRKKSIG